MYLEGNSHETENTTATTQNTQTPRSHRPSLVIDVCHMLPKVSTGVLSDFLFFDSRFSVPTNHFDTPGQAFILFFRPSRSCSNIT